MFSLHHNHFRKNMSIEVYFKGDAINLDCLTTKLNYKIVHIKFSRLKNEIVTEFSDGPKIIKHKSSGYNLIF